jgi:putative ABC transport system permease protein
MGPLVRGAAQRSLREGPWVLLVVAAFAVACAAAAVAPVFTAAVASAALGDQIAAVPDDAQAADSPVVRLVGGTGAPGAGRLAHGLDDVPGLGPATRTAASLGAETKSWDEVFESFVSLNGRSERVRLFGDDGMPGALVTASGGPLPAAPKASTDAPAIWLPQPVVERLGARPGDALQLGVRTRHEVRTAPVLLAGAYGVGPDGRLPADPPGTHRWSYRRGSVPVDSEFGVVPAHLAVTDVAGAGELGEEVGDEILYSLEAPLASRSPTLRETQRTVAGVHDLQVALRDPQLVGDQVGPTREHVVSGLPHLVAAAQAVTSQTRTWTRPLMIAGVALGLLAIAGVAVLGAMRRSVELGAAVTWGVRPAGAAGLAALEVLPAAVLGWLLGVALAWLAVSRVGASATTGWSPVAEGAARALGVAAAGCLVVATVTGIAAWRASRLRRHHRDLVLPWQPALVLIAVTATAGLLARENEVGTASLLDVLVPVLVVCAAGALVGRAALALLGSGARSPGGARLRRPAVTLARARAAGSGAQAVLVVTVLAAGLGLTGYSLAAAHSVDEVVQDRAAVLAGADATTPLQASWLLDPDAAVIPEPDANGSIDPDPVPGSRTPPLPAGTTIVWRARVSVPPDLGNVDLLVIDPERFADVAAWGVGPELASARGAVRRLATADAATSSRQRAGEHGVPVPAIAVGDVGVDVGEQASVETTSGRIPVDVQARQDAFPGHQGALGLVVVPADTFFQSLGAQDPRLRPPDGSPRFDSAPVDFYPSLWTSGGVGQLRAVTQSAGVELKETSTLARVTQQPQLVAARRALGPQLALGAMVGLAAALVLVMYADRRARTGQAADVLLARMGLGRRGVLRSRAGELALVAGLGLLGGVLGGALLMPFGARLLDPGAGQAPAFALRPGPWALVAMVLVAGLALLLAVGMLVLRARRVDEAGVLRDAD